MEKGHSPLGGMENWDIQRERYGTTRAHVRVRNLEDEVELFQAERTLLERQIADRQELNELLEIFVAHLEAEHSSGSVDAFYPVGGDSHTTLGFIRGRYAEWRHHVERFRVRATGAVLPSPQDYNPFSRYKVERSFAARLVVEHLHRGRSFERVSRQIEKVGHQPISEGTLKALFETTVLIMMREVMEMVREAKSFGFLIAAEAAIPVFDNVKGVGKPIGHYRVYAHPPTHVIFFTFTRGWKALPADWTIEGFRGLMTAPVWDDLGEPIPAEGLYRSTPLSVLRDQLLAAGDGGLEAATELVGLLEKLMQVCRDHESAGLTGPALLEARGRDLPPLLDPVREALESLAGRQELPSKWRRLSRATVEHWARYTRLLQHAELGAAYEMPAHGIPLLTQAGRSFLYAPTAQAAFRNSIMYSLIATCHARREDPCMVMQDMLDELWFLQKKGSQG